MIRFVPALILVLGCRAPRAEQDAVVFDALGLPDCAATWDSVGVCAAIKPWASSVPDGFDPGWKYQPVRWVGAEADPYFCTEDAAEAEAFAVAHEPDSEGGSHRLDLADPRWFDVIRFDAEGTSVARHRVLRCTFLYALGEAPPGLVSNADLARYGTLPVEDEDQFYPVFREMLMRRDEVLPVQVVLAWGEVQTESLHLRTCNVRCGDCEDGSGGRTREVTGVLERLDVELNPVTGVVSYTATPELEAACYAAW